MKKKNDIQTQKTYVFIKLSSHEDILCELVPSETNTSIKNPLKVFYVADTDHLYFSLGQWIAFTDQTSLTINSLCIITMAALSESMTDLYLMRLEEIEQEKAGIFANQEPLAKTETVESEEDEAVTKEKIWLN